MEQLAECKQDLLETLEQRNRAVQSSAHNQRQCVAWYLQTRNLEKEKAAIGGQYQTLTTSSEGAAIELAKTKADAEQKGQENLKLKARSVILAKELTQVTRQLIECKQDLLETTEQRNRAVFNVMHNQKQCVTWNGNYRSCTERCERLENVEMPEAPLVDVEQADIEMRSQLQKRNAEVIDNLQQFVSANTANDDLVNLDSLGQSLNLVVQYLPTPLLGVYYTSISGALQQTEILFSKTNREWQNVRENLVKEANRVMPVDVEKAGTSSDEEADDAFSADEAPKRVEDEKDEVIDVLEDGKLYDSLDLAVGRLITMFEGNRIDPGADSDALQMLQADGTVNATLYFEYSPQVINRLASLASNMIAARITNGIQPDPNHQPEKDVVAMLVGMFFVETKDIEAIKRVSTTWKGHQFFEGPVTLETYIRLEEAFDLVHTYNADRQARSVLGRRIMKDLRNANNAQKELIGCVHMASTPAGALECVDDFAKGIGPENQSYIRKLFGELIAGEKRRTEGEQVFEAPASKKNKPTGGLTRSVFSKIGNPS
jgi:hypothetical protein